MVTAIKENGRCADCGGRFPAIVMEFDHVRGRKKFTVSNRVHGHTGLAPVLAEIAKCDLVCANCHRVRTWKRSQHKAR